MAQYRIDTEEMLSNNKTIYEVVMVEPSPEGAGGLSYSGEAVSIPIIPVVQLNSYEGLKERDTQTYSALGGDVADVDTTIAVSCSSTTGSYGVYRSRRFIPFRAGQTCVARILSQFDTPAAGTQQRIGVANQENGYYVGYNGAGDLQFMHSYGGTAEIWTLDVDNTASGDQTITLTLNDVVYTIAILNSDTVNEIASKIQAEVDSDAPWLANQVDDKLRLLSGSLGNLTGTFSFSSTGNVTGTLTKHQTGAAATDEWEDITLPSWYRSLDFNHWQFKWSWDGITVFLMQHSTNRWVPIHRHATYTDTGLPVTKPAFKTTAVAYNTGGAAGVEMQVASMFGGIEGQQQITTFTHGGGATQVSMNTAGTYYHIMSVQNPFVHRRDTDYFINYRMIRFLDLTVAGQVNDPVEIYIYFNQPISGGNFNFVGYFDRIYQGDTELKVMDVSADTPVVALTLGNTGASSRFDLSGYNLLLPPGTHMSLVAKSAGNMSRLAIAGTWATVG